MAQPQQQQQFSMSQRQFSPQDAPSPAGQQSYPFPPQKRQRLSPNPQSTPTSPYTQSPYAMSPGPAGPPSATASPHFANVSLPAGVYNTPYSNGNTTPTLSLPTTPQPQHQMHHSQQNPLNYSSQTHSMASTYQNYNMPQHGAGMMGPPSKPPEKKDNESDAMDILNGTGIDLKEEEQYMINNSFNHELTRSHAGFATAAHSYSQFPPGNAASFYGAGPANAPAESADGKSQEEYIRLAADSAWHDAARRLAMSREREIYDPFLFTMLLQKKVDKAAREQGLTIRAGGWVLPENFHNSTVDVKTAVGPSGSMVQTNGRFLSEDAQLADQSALLSLATKQRLLGFIEDAAALAKARQTGSHGIVPEEWTDVAAPVDLSASTIVSEGGVRVGWESAVDPASASRKRSASGPAKMPTPVSDSVKTPSDGLKMANDVVVALRAIASKERDYEEARLQKRNARAAGVGTTSRQGSILPGTPGSIAPEASEKAPTKKEQTKKAQAKVNEAANHAAANQTTNQFLGGGGGMFGKKKKVYSWMSTGAGGGSGASTPSRVMAQGGGHSALGTPPVPDKLTSDGVRRVGAWREDHDKGKGIQLRDWIAVLEEDGREKRALQLAYMNLDDSGPK